MQQGPKNCQQCLRRIGTFLIPNCRHVSKLSLVCNICLKSRQRGELSIKLRSWEKLIESNPLVPMMQSEVQRNCSERHQLCMAAAAFLDEREKEELRSRTGVGLVEQWWNPSRGV
ncbi:hypothetical protein ACE6H2_010863 [Prunus campanulata]